ncbi:class I SAM-dependent methyltransferase [Nitrosopumilus sp.]|uniref:class I SAM-dependent methyltransferase n=1 Tax=Nitrosopumilus sp. TaxID=2024843 RepID=UPI0026077945|nr:class I SAM-dependent methyltransferase [Nitrosopumilus sp.]
MNSHKCRFCNSSINNVFVDLGISPLSNSFLKENDLSEPEKKFPLKVLVCQKCFLVQIPEFETPDNIFSEYAYFSSYSKNWLNHIQNYVEMISKKINLNQNSLVVELASNDGYLLQFFKDKKIPVLGIEPAANVAKVAQQKGIETMVNFFSEKLSDGLVKKSIKADLIVGNNVLAHVPNINDFIRGMKKILKSDGMINMEFPHVLELIKNNQFDTIYHEHFSYLSLNTVKMIFEFHNMTIFDVEEISTHGGSLRIYVKHKENENIPIKNSVELLLKKEDEFGLLDISTYENFSQKTNHIKRKLIDFFNEAKQKGDKIVCYGAAAKGNTLLNFCKIGKEHIEYVVDNNPYKQGLYLPGTHLEIKDPIEIKNSKPKYIVILPWNIKDEIMNDISFIHEWGGKFVIPIPEVEII